MYWHNWHHGVWIWPAIWLVFVLLLVIGAALWCRRSWRWASGMRGPYRGSFADPRGNSEPERVLAERFARGEIDAAEYRDRLNVLREASAEHEHPH